MADPTPYERGYSFTDFQTANPTTPLPGPQVDSEMENVELAVGQLISAIKDIRRSDGKIRNDVLQAAGVEYATSWRFPVAWTTLTAFSASTPAHVVTFGGETYFCLVSHTSGTFATDLAAGKWLKLGAKGADGTNGQGVPSGGATGQVLAKNTGTAFDAGWVNPLAIGTTAGTAAAGNDSRLTDKFRKVTTTLDPVSWAITAISKANPCVMTIPGHTMIVGDLFFVGDAGGMQEVRFAWYYVSAVSGSNVTVGTTISRKGEVSSITTLLNSVSYTTYTSGATASPQLSRVNYTAPPNLAIPEVDVTVRGSGSAGGGSAWGQFGGAGAGGACIRGTVPLTAGQVVACVIDRGMPGIPAGLNNNNYMFSGVTAFGPYSVSGAAVGTTSASASAGATAIVLTSAASIFVDMLLGTPMTNGATLETRVQSIAGTTVNLFNPLPAGVASGVTIRNFSPKLYSGDLWAASANIGQHATNDHLGGDGGAGGVAGGTYQYQYNPGGKGAGSPPAILDGGATYFNASFPCAGDGAYGGGQGADIGQDGNFPGGGGAPGNNDSSVEAGFACTAAVCPRYPTSPTGGREPGQSGAGAPGRIEVEVWVHV